MTSRYADMFANLGRREGAGCSLCLLARGLCSRGATLALACPAAPLTRSLKRLRAAGGAGLDWAALSCSLEPVRGHRALAEDQVLRRLPGDVRPLDAGQRS